MIICKSNVQKHTSIHKHQPRLKGENMRSEHRPKLFRGELARGSAVVTGARAAFIQASILSGPLGAGDMHVPDNI